MIARAKTSRPRKASSPKAGAVASSKKKPAKPARKKVSVRARSKKTAARPAKQVVQKPARQVVQKIVQKVVQVVTQALDDMKAVDVTVLDVRNLTDIADTMIVASGNSDRHVRSIADRIVENAKRAGFRPMGVEGERDGEWVLVDLQDLIIHIMLPRVREFYRLENLWDISAARREFVVTAS
jgi:ribosome-associated protein